jgi:hypothetical protein
MGKNKIESEMTEHQIQEAIFSWFEVAVNKYPDLDLAYSTASGVRMPIGLLMKCKRLGIVKKGLPDIVIPIPKGPYHSMYIELKITKSSPSRTSAEQINYVDRLNSLGHYAIVLKGFNNTVNEIEKYLRL